MKKFNVAIYLMMLDLLTGCAAMMPELATITHDICDSVVSVEIDRDAFKEESNIHILVDIINKDPPRVSGS